MGEAGLFIQCSESFASVLMYYMSGCQYIGPLSANKDTYQVVIDVMWYLGMLILAVSFTYVVEDKYCT